jgi:hypothetical protein
LKNSIKISANMFIRDTSGSRPGSVVLYALTIVAVSYLVGCLRFWSYWPFTGHGAMQGATNAEAVITVLLLVPGFLYTRLNLPERGSIAGQLRRLPRLLARVTIGSAAALAAAFAATDNLVVIRLALAVCIAGPLAAMLAIGLASRAVVRDLLPVTAKLPGWAQSGAPLNGDGHAPGRFADWFWLGRRTTPDAVFGTTAEVVDEAEAEL